MAPSDHEGKVVETASGDHKEFPDGSEDKGPSKGEDSMLGAGTGMTPRHQVRPTSKLTFDSGHRADHKGDAAGGQDGPRPRGRRPLCRHG